MERLGIIAAADDEIQPLIDQMQIESVIETAKLKLFVGQWQKQAVIAVRCGVGKVNAALAAQLLINQSISALLMIGTAGALDSRLKIGDVVILEQCTYHDVDFQGVLMDYHPYMKDPWFASDPKLTAWAKAAATQADLQGQVWTGRGVTGDQFIDQDQRDSIIERLDPLCVDMESAAVAHVAYANDVPFLAIRAISDTPFNSGLEVYHAHSESAAKQALILFNAMMRKGKPIE
ncbi:5'-methylthioadenosine/adenosylhomocysteine nucleosidase [Holdemania massiliensis]|uniref:5'-methylthioadenosine/adenosylhomocysteine nucleosidase n=1 Tax=Holdemania massiliensis TaxID=1468449 RepID=UPI00352270C9